MVMVVEPIRSDFTSKFLHHILTCAVVIACCNSRAYSLLYIVLLTADLADILLAVGGSQTITITKDHVLIGLLVCSNPKMSQV